MDNLCNICKHFCNFINFPFKLQVTVIKIVGERRNFSVETTNAEVECRFTGKTVGKVCDFLV